MLRLNFCHPQLSFFFNDPVTTEIYTLSLHDALPILRRSPFMRANMASGARPIFMWAACFRWVRSFNRSEEHTSELQSLRHLVCRLLLEKKKRVDSVIVYRNFELVCECKSGCILESVR